MVIIFEIIVAVTLIYGVIKIAVKVLDDRKELMKLREERLARLESAKTTKEVAQELLLDKEMAQEICGYLSTELEKGRRSDKETD